MNLIRLGAAAASRKVNIDPYWADVVLLCHYDTNFNDVKGNAVSTLGAGLASINTSIKPFGNGSLRTYSGNGLQYAATSGFALGAGDATIECFMYMVADGKTLLSTLGDYPSYESGFGLTPYTGGIGFQYNTTGYAGPSASISLNTWYHLAMVVQSGAVKMYIDGILQGSVTPSGSVTGDGPLNVGYENVFGDLSSSFDGYIKELRITKGVARYTANFVPPSGAFPEG